MKISVILDLDRDQDILDAMPKEAKSAWIREKIRHALRNESEINEQQIVSVIERYLGENHTFFKENLTQTPSKFGVSQDDHTNTSGSNNISNYARESSQKHHSKSTWTMPE